jgi:signal transduction histidine kinase
LFKVFSLFDESQPERTTAETLENAKKEITATISRPIPTQQKAVALMRIEKTCRDKVEDIRRSITVTRPRGVGLSRALSNEWTAYTNQFERVANNVLVPAENEIERYVSTAAARAKIPLNDAARLTAAVSEVSTEAMRSVRNLRTDVGSLNVDIGNRVRDAARESFTEVSHVVDEVNAELDRLQRSTRKVEDLSAIRERLTGQITDVFTRERLKLERLRDQLNETNKLWDKDGYDTAELVEAVEEELDELRQPRDADLELAQIGLALNTISHEFSKTVASIRSGIERLGAWAAENPQLHDLHRQIQLSFGHLDEYLTLFTQLDRRTHGAKVRISGKDVFDFVKRLYSQRLARHQIQLTASKSFLQRALNSYPSSVFPAFVNLIDNSIYWLQRNRGSREIRLDSDGLAFLIRDNGPGVASRDRENIFALNFSRAFSSPIESERDSRIGLVLN